MNYSSFKVPGVSTGKRAHRLKSKSRNVNVGETTLASNINKLFNPVSHVHTKSMGTLKEYKVPDHFAVEFEQTEFLDEVAGSSTFHITSFNINAGNSQVFPQLSNIAQLFESYVFKEIIFEYRPLVKDQISSSNTAMGEVLMNVNYNVYSNQFTRKSDMLNYEYTTSCKPSDTMVYKVDLDNLKHRDNTLRMFYVRGQAPYGQDLRLYDLGMFNFAHEGQQSSGVIGELWIKYKVCLYKQVIYQPIVTQGLVSGNWEFSGSTITNLWGTNPNLPNIAKGPLVNDVTFTNDSSGVGTIHFPSYVNNGYFLVNTLLNDPSGPAFPNSSTLTNCSGVLMFTNSAGSQVSEFICVPTGSALTSANCTTAIKLTAPSATIQYSGLIHPGNGNVVVYISQLDPQCLLTYS